MFEEYPSERPSLPLNGHLQTLLGLYDLSDVSPQARRCSSGAPTRLCAVLPQYDCGRRWSLYNLVYQFGFAPVPARPSTTPRTSACCACSTSSGRTTRSASGRTGGRRPPAYGSSTRPSSTRRAIRRGSCSAHTKSRLCAPIRAERRAIPDERP